MRGPASAKSTVRFVVAVATTALIMGLGWVPITSGRAARAQAAMAPEMCSGRSDPDLQITAQSSGTPGSVPAYFLNVSNDSSGVATGTMIVGIPGGAERLVVNDWCRVWQHQPGQPSNGSCGMTYPAGAVTAHAVGTATLDGQDLLVRTDVRQLATGQMLYRVRYRPLATGETTEDDCETGWTRLPAEGWYPLNSFSVTTASPPTGYRLVDRGGGVFAFNAPFYGSMAGSTLNQRVVALAPDPVSHGYRLVAADGGVFSFNAPFYGSLAGTHLNRPVIGAAEDPLSAGYWLVASDGGVFTLGKVPFYGSMGGQSLNAPVVGMAGDPATGGYWLAAADGGVFSFGAPYYGSVRPAPLKAPIVGIVSTPTGRGYWLVGADGGVFAYGDAGFYGSPAGRQLGGPVVGLAVTPDAHGYWLVGADGGVLAYGDAPFYGSRSGLPTGGPIVAMAAAT